MTAEELVEIEQIRALRSAYSACVDSGDMAALAELFCEDAVCEFPERFGGRCVGRDAIVRELAARRDANSGPLDAIHVVTNPWITLTGPDTAHGRCYLIDLLDRQHTTPADPASHNGNDNRDDNRDSSDNPLLALGRCEDDYRKVDGTWRFASIQLPYFWADTTSGS